VLVAVTVYRTTCPGEVAVTFAMLTIVNVDTAVVVVQRGSVEPVGQLLPVVVEVMVLVRLWLPVSGLSTVTE